MKKEHSTEGSDSEDKPIISRSKKSKFQKISQKNQQKLARMRRQKISKKKKTRSLRKRTK